MDFMLMTNMIKMYIVMETNNLFGKIRDRRPFAYVAKFSYMQSSDYIRTRPLAYAIELLHVQTPNYMYHRSFVHVVAQLSIQSGVRVVARLHMQVWDRNFEIPNVHKEQSISKAVSDSREDSYSDLKYEEEELFSNLEDMDEEEGPIELTSIAFKLNKKFLANKISYNEQ
ncbi:hypothetical protein KI387_022417, partial [Taxus chinensis]